MIPEIPEVSERVLAQVALVVLVAALALTAVIVVAALLIHARGAADARRRARRTARWTPRVLALLDGDLSPEDWSRSIWPHQREAALRFLVTWAVRLRGADRRRLAEAARPFLPLARRRLASCSPGWRAFGAHTLGLLSVRPPIVELGAALRDPDRAVALAAARALAQSAGPASARILLSAVSRFGGAHPAGAASLLAGLGVPAGRHLLAALGRPGIDPRARVALVEALMRLSYTPAAPLARDLLASPGTRPDVRVAVLRLLGEIGGSEDAFAVRSFCTHPDAVTRIHAVAALGRLQTMPADADVLRAARSDANGWVALRASEALGDTAGGPTADGLAPLAPLDAFEVTDADVERDPSLLPSAV